MANIQTINVSTPNDNLGDTLRDSQIKSNQNFAELNSKKVEVQAGKELSDNNFTDADKAVLDSIENNAQVNVQSDWLQEDDQADDFIKNKPISDFVSAVGTFHYADLATQTVPLVILPNTAKKLENDTLGIYTIISNAPFGVSSVWNPTTNQLDFSQLTIGDTLTLRIDAELTTTVANQINKAYITFGVGSAFEYNLIAAQNQVKTAGVYPFIAEVNFDLAYQEIIDNPAEIYLFSDDDATIKINGWYIEILRKNINVIDIQFPTSVRQDINFGSVATNAMDTINNALPNILIQDQNLGQIKIQGTFIGVYHEYLFTGVKGYYGNGALQCTDDDLLELGASGGGGSETTATMGALIGSAGDATPNDTDYVATALTGGGLLKKITLTNAKAFLKTYFDTLYAAILVSGTNIKTKGGISLLGSGDIPNSAKITTTVSITNATLTVAGDVQEGKIIKIDNGVNVINYTVNGAINASFIKMGTGAITFVQGPGRTLTGANGTLVLNGAVNSTASIVSDGTVDTIYINNL